MTDQVQALPTLEEAVSATVKAFLVKNGYTKEEAAIDLEASLKDDFGLDSLDIAEVCVAIDTSFNNQTNLNARDLEGVKNIQSLVDNIRKNYNEEKLLPKPNAAANAKTTVEKTFLETMRAMCEKNGYLAKKQEFTIDTSFTKDLKMKDADRDAFFNEIEEMCGPPIVLSVEGDLDTPRAIEETLDTMFAESAPEWRKKFQECVV